MSAHTCSNMRGVEAKAQRTMVFVRIEDRLLHHFAAVSQPVSQDSPRIPACTVFVLSKPVAILGDHPPIFG